jgi:hypothetical protein
MDAGRVKAPKSKGSRADAGAVSTAPQGAAMPEGELQLDLPAPKKVEKKK